MSVCGILFCACFIPSQRWVLPFRGQQEMFLCDWGYISGILFQPGGLAELVARFLVQFFTVPGVGAAVTIVILGLNAWMVWRIMEQTVQREETAWGIFPLSLLPSAFLAVSLQDYYCLYQGLIAYVAAVACLLAYSKSKAGASRWYRGA